MRSPYSWHHLTLITSQRPHIQIPLHWGSGLQGFNIRILEGHSSLHSGVPYILKMRTLRLRWEKRPVHNISTDSNSCPGPWKFQSSSLGVCRLRVESNADDPVPAVNHFSCCWSCWLKSKVQEAGQYPGGLRVKWCHGNNKGSEPPACPQISARLQTWWMTLTRHSTTLSPSLLICEMRVWWCLLDWIIY